VANVNNYVRLHKGVPPIELFSSSVVTPIVIDVLTGFAYYMYNNVVYPLQMAPASSVGAFSDGFSSGFS
jgi:hypothetical protein